MFCLSPIHMGSFERVLASPAVTLEMWVTSLREKWVIGEVFGGGGQDCLLALSEPLVWGGCIQKPKQ